jgi:hypothetical protein
MLSEENAKKQNKSPKNSLAVFAPSPLTSSEISGQFILCFHSAALHKPSLSTPLASCLYSLQWPPASSSPSLPPSPIPSPLHLTKTQQKKAKKTFLNLSIYLNLNKIKERKRQREGGGGRAIQEA